MNEDHNSAPVKYTVRLSADRRAQNLQAIDWQDRDLLAEIKCLRALLTRYRNEVSIGHQPHMIVHLVDEVMKAKQ